MRQLEEKIYLDYTSTLKEVRTGTQTAGSWRQKLVQRHERVLLTILLIMVFSVSIAIEPMNHQPRDGITHNGLGPPPLITKKMPDSKILWSHFFNFNLLYSSNSSFCEINIKPTNNICVCVHIYT